MSIDDRPLTVRKMVSLQKVQTWEAVKAQLRTMVILEGQLTDGNALDAYERLAVKVKAFIADIECGAWHE